MLAAILLVGRVGPESYFGVDDDVITWGILGLYVLWALAARSISQGTDVETDPDSAAAVGEHYRPTTAAADEGVYRVVGTGDEVTLLRVTNADGRRANTGEIRHVDQSTLDGGFEAADDPDGDASPLATVKDALSGLYWNVRKFF